MFPHEAVPDGAVFAPHHFWIGVGIAVFAFGLTWRYYPVTGAVGTLVGLSIALDDAVSHAFGVPTPLDLLWANYIHPYMM
jgi:hypothetical protein